MWLFFTQVWVHVWVLQTLLPLLPVQLQLLLEKPLQLAEDEPVSTVTVLLPFLVLVQQPL